MSAPKLPNIPAMSKNNKVVLLPRIIALESTVKSLKSSNRWLKLGMLGFSLVGGAAGYLGHQVMHRHHGFWFEKVEPRISKLESFQASTDVSETPPLSQFEEN